MNETALTPEVVTYGIAEQLTRGEFDIQIATAKRFPRDPKAAADDITTLATLDDATAADCFYVVPRDGKMIEGPSARFAEIVLQSWGNVLGGARVLAVENDAVVAQGVFWDLEKNVRVTYEVRRRIIGKNGKRYSPDMINTTANAACSIALRNAVFKGVPKSAYNPGYEGARKIAAGDESTVKERRAKMVAHFDGMGVDAARVCNVVNREAVEDISLKDLLVLRGIANAIKDGDTTPAAAFPPVGGTGDEKADAVGAAMTGTRERKEPPAPPPGTGQDGNKDADGDLIPFPEDTPVPELDDEVEVKKGRNVYVGTVEDVVPVQNVFTIRSVDTNRPVKCAIHDPSGSTSWRRPERPEPPPSPGSSTDGDEAGNGGDESGDTPDRPLSETLALPKVGDPVNAPAGQDNASAVCRVVSVTADPDQDPDLEAAEITVQPIGGTAEDQVTFPLVVGDGKLTVTRASDEELTAALTEAANAGQEPADAGDGGDPGGEAGQDELKF